MTPYRVVFIRATFPRWRRERPGVGPEKYRPRRDRRDHHPQVATSGTSLVVLSAAMNLTDALKGRNGPFHTYEFFPPRTEAGLVNLLDRIRRLASPPLPSPLAVSVTWGAGGATADRSLELAEEVVKMGLDVILHLTCTNMPKEKVDQALTVRPSTNYRDEPDRCSEIEGAGYPEHFGSAR